MTDLEKRVYHKLDGLAEGAHRAFNSDMYAGWIDEYTEQFLALIHKETLKTLENFRAELDGKTYSENTDWQRECRRIVIKLDARIAQLKNGDSDE